MIIALKDAISSLPLKEMDGTLLLQELHSYAGGVHILHDDFLYTGEHVKDAIALASFAHRSQYRANRGPMPKVHYIEHPLRNAVRLHRYGMVDVRVILATILHDVVEDAPAIIVQILDPKCYDEDYTPIEMRSYAIRAIQDHFGYVVSQIIADLSNPLERPNVKRSKSEKRADYLVHFESILESPDVFWGKFVDWIDNGAGLKHNVSGNPGMIGHLAAKYRPAGELLAVRMLKDEDGSIRALVSDEGYTTACRQLTNGIESLRRLEAEFPV